MFEREYCEENHHHVDNDQSFHSYTVCYHFLFPLKPIIPRRFPGAMDRRS